MTNWNQESRVVLPMYTEVNRLKQVFRHFEGIPIPLPVSVTITGLMVGILWIVAALKWLPMGDPLTMYVGIPIFLVMIISYLEPEHMTPVAWMYACIRKMTCPTRRVINRSVPPKGHWIEYRQYSLVRGQGGKQ